jgi:hypothetical protein
MAFPSADVKVEKFIIIKYASYTLVLFPAVHVKTANTLRSHSKAAWLSEIRQARPWL